MRAKIICEQKLNQSVNTSDCQRSEARAPEASALSSEKILLYMHNRQQLIKSLKMVVETSDKNQYSYFYILNLFLKMTWWNIAQLLNATHLLVNIRKAICKYAVASYSTVHFEIFWQDSIIDILPIPTSSIPSSIIPIILLFLYLPMIIYL